MKLFLIPKKDKYTIEAEKRLLTRLKKEKIKVNREEGSEVVDLILILKISLKALGEVSEEGVEDLEEEDLEEEVSEEGVEDLEEEVLEEEINLDDKIEVVKEDKDRDNRNLNPKIKLNLKNVNI